MQTNVVSFSAVTGNEPGTAILSFTVDGMDSETWSVTYSAPGVAENKAIFSGHMLVLNAGPSVYQPPYHAWGTYLLDPRAGYEMCFSSEKFEEAIARGVNKMMVHDPYRTDDRLTRLFKTLPEAVPGPEYTSSWVTNIEINPPTMNKGKSVIRLAEHLGVAMDEVMTLGDNDNDLPMLEVAGYSVAMGNGTPNAIAAAKYITCSNRQAGLAKAIRKLVFHEDIPCVRRMQ